MATFEKVQSTIFGLHEFFVDWFSGQIEPSADDFQKRFTSRFDPAFRLIPPAGNLLSLDQLSGSIQSGHGNNPDFRIQIRNVQILWQQGPLVLATYEEWQRNAKASTPIDNGRIATAAFELDDARPDGVRWLHVHETWLPQAVMAKGPFDF